MTAIDRRYIRHLVTDPPQIGDWHERIDTGSALCGSTLPPFDSNVRYQHQRGSYFPIGSVCPDCRDARKWLDVEQDGPITDTPTAPW